MEVFTSPCFHEHFITCFLWGLPTVHFMHDSKRRKTAKTSTEAELTLPTSSRHLEAVPLIVDPIPTLPTVILPPPIPVHPIQPPPQIRPLHQSSSSSEAGSDDEEAIPESGLISCNCGFVTISLKSSHMLYLINVPLILGYISVI